MPAHDRAVDDAEGLVLDAVRGLVAALHPYAPPPVQLDSALDRHLGLDSLALAELLVRLEATLGVGLPTGLLRTAAALRDLVWAIGPAAACPRPAGSRRAIPEEPARSPQELTGERPNLARQARGEPTVNSVRPATLKCLLDDTGWDVPDQVAAAESRGATSMELPGRRPVRTGSATVPPHGRV